MMSMVVLVRPHQHTAIYFPIKSVEDARRPFHGGKGGSVIDGRFLTVIHLSG